MVETTRLRDACILLAGHRPYREYPLEWTRRQLARAGVSVLATERFPILYSDASITRQLEVGARKLPLFTDRALAAAMGAHVEDMRARIKAAVAEAPNQRIKLGFDYVIAAERTTAAAQAALALAAEATGLPQPPPTTQAAP